MQYKDRVLVGMPIPLVFKFRPGAQISCTIQHADSPGTHTTVSLVEVPSPVSDICFYAGTFVPDQVGWYYATATLNVDGGSVGADALRFYSFSQEDDVPPSIGEAVVQEIPVKVGTTALLAYRGLPELLVEGSVVYESETSGISLTFTPRSVPAGFSALYAASFSPTREGRYFVHIKTTPSGGDALIVVSAFKTLPYSRAAGTIKSSATSTVT